MDIVLYVFLLENNKFLLHPSSKHNQNLFIELELLYDFVNLNKPIKLLESYYIFDVTEIDKYVKEYMLNKGIENVRGGSYVETDLPDYKLKTLNDELKLNKNTILNNSLCINSIIKKYKDMDIESIIIEKNKLEKQLNEYKKIKQDYQYYGTLITMPKIVRIDRKIIFNLEWLNENITFSKFCEAITSKETKDIYNDTILLLTKLSKLFSEKFPDYEFSQLLPYKRPDVVFDNIFLHKHYFNNYDNSILIASEVYKNFEFMYYKMLNYIEELEFDISTYPDNIEEELLLTIKYIDTRLRIDK
jgi:hypothetical protein